MANGFGGHAKIEQVEQRVQVLVDVLSKRAWAEPMKNKTGPEMVKALDKIKKKLSPHRPLRVQTDDRKEFFDQTVQAWFKKQGWHHFSSKGDAKAAVVERWHRTLKQRMYRAFTAQNSLKYLDLLPKLIHTYNRTPHRSIGMAPIDVTFQNQKKVWHRLYDKRLSPQKGTLLKVGDRVRLNQKHRPFKKGYLPGWTEEVFVVSYVRPTPLPTYRLREWDGTPIKGTFYNEDVQKVNVTEDSLFRVEKILKRQKGRVLVRWKGWPSKYDSWIPSHGTRQTNPSKKTDLVGPTTRRTNQKTSKTRRSSSPHEETTREGVSQKGTRQNLRQFG